MNKFEKQKQDELTLLNESIFFPNDFQYNKKQRDIQRCEKCLNDHPDKYCPNYAKCPYVNRNTANTIINKFKDFTEVVFYNDNFYIPDGIDVNTNVDRSRRWIKDERGVLHPRDDDVTLDSLKKTLLDSRKRSLDNLYGYVLCNDWQYFVTVTFRQGKTGKLSDGLVMYQWQKFRQQLQYKFKDIKILLFKEDTPTGKHGLHFHGFIGGCNIDEYLQQARNNKKIYKGKENPRYGEVLYTKFGDPIFNFKSTLTNVGFTTVVKIKQPDLLKLSNYMTKYMTKSTGSFEYNENCYFHTNNLDFKDKEVARFSQKEKQELVSNLFATCYKKTDRYSIYRIFLN